MKRAASRYMLAAVCAALACGAAQARPFPDPRFERAGLYDAAPAVEAAPRDAACESAVLVSAGGQFPRDPHTLAVRWTGYGNFELVYQGRIILLDAYFDRGSFFPPLGFKAADITRADVILLGHGHADHMSDAASVGARTGAIVIGAPVTTEKLLTQAIDAKQVRTVTGRGGEVLQFEGFTVEPILGRHGEPPEKVVGAINEALKSVTEPLTTGEIAERETIRKRGISGDPRVVTEGTLAFLITLDSGFRIMFRDSGGPITDYERAAMARIGRVDLALVAVSAAYLQSLTVQQALEHMQTYKPDVYMPAHHDAPLYGLWRPTEPLFQAVRSDNPRIVTVSRGYREPTCFNTDYNIVRSSRDSK